MDDETFWQEAKYMWHVRFPVVISSYQEVMDVGSIWTTEKIRFRPVKECMSSLFFFKKIPLLLIKNLCYFAHGLFAETYFECTEVLAVLLKQSIFDGAVSMSHHLAPQKAKQKPVYHGSRIPKILTDHCTSDSKVLSCLYAWKMSDLTHFHYLYIFS